MDRKNAVWKAKRRRFVMQRAAHSLGPLVNHGNYGINVFEGDRIYRLVDGRRAIFRWEDHKRRLIQSAAAYGMPVSEWPFTPDQLWTAALNVAALNEQDSYHRPCIYVDGDIKVHDPAYTISAWVTTRDWNPDTSPYLPTKSGRGLRLLVTNLRRSPPQAQTWAKGAGNYQLSYVAKKMAIARGLDDAIVLDSGGQNISEGSGYAVMFYERRTNLILCPDEGSSALDSITVRTVEEIAQKFCGVTLLKGKVPLGEVFEADEIFVAGTAIEVAGVGYIEEQSTGRHRTLSDAPGELTREIQRIYREVVTSKTVIHESWYTRLPIWSQVVFRS